MKIENVEIHLFKCLQLSLQGKRSNNKYRAFERKIICIHCILINSNHKNQCGHIGSAFLLVFLLLFSLSLLLPPFSL